ncbi:hypothetical protein LWI28_009642 [Acer negundo]|uniref:Uncharacterized protein n=1 Tax=Acer negundo TaxID=4023 RepID=A0AAD5J546_ACENE|nr:hypothetical protein LWI28_009642 [Acer negundo]
MDISTHEPPFQETYGVLFQNSTTLQKAKDHDQNHSMVDNNKECELPLIDLDRLNFRYLDNDHLNNFQELGKCIEEMVEAASEWGFFQVVNHGIPRKVLDSMRYEEMKMFHQPFYKKSEENFVNLLANSYRWGNPTATCLRQLSWSEAFNIPLTDISRLDNECNNSRSAIGLFLEKAAGLAQRLAEVLAQNLGAVSNGVYKSIEHRVIAHPEVERFSMAYFYCPSNEAVIESCSHPTVYRKFSFGEYKQQIQMDVRATGDKVGLSRFLL